MVQATLCLGGAMSNTQPFTKGRTHRSKLQAGAVEKRTRKPRPTISGWDHRRSKAALWRRAIRSQSAVAAAQGTCYLLMGLWPLTHMESFETFTGPKHNTALMQVAASMMAVIGIILLLGSLQRVVTSTTAYLGAGIAGVMALLACTFVSSGRMPVVYALDGALEGGFVAWWILARLSARTRPKSGSAADQAITYTTYLDRVQRGTLH